MTGLLTLLFLALLAWFWMDSIRAKEIAMQASAQACQQINAQFLDQTASLKSLKLMRKETGRLGLKRLYEFKFSHDRESRSNGYVEINGHQVNKVFLDENETTTILK